MTQRRRFAVGVLLGTALIALFGLVGSSVTTPATAADLSAFDPGNIISDEVFFDNTSMSISAIQTFLNQKGANCTSGSYCLKNYRADSNTRVAATSSSPGCPGGYNGASQETAATIIWRVGIACGINPQVLLVTLQKEQGLVTATSPDASDYVHAMGYGCPDTAACDSTYNGLFNQVYMAARQFKRYQAGVVGGYKPGITNYIGYYPAVGSNLSNARCGTQAVFIKNQATAGLYNYTPYVPNRAALNAGYGLGDSCSSYGNRNFYAYFTDWFGSTQSSGTGAINVKYMTMGGTSSPLGAPVADTTCTLPSGGCGRQFQNGSIYWSRASGAAAVSGDVLYSWWATGSVSGPLGYPIADSGLIPGGSAGAFQGGSLYFSAGTGGHWVANEMLQNWWNSGGTTGTLGWPVADSGAVDGGKATAFQGGSIYWSKTSGAHWLTGDLLVKFWDLGSVTGVLGFPTSDFSTVPGGSGAAFQNGSLYASAGTGAHAVRGGARSAWWARGGVTGPLGFPVDDTADLKGKDGSAGQKSGFSGGTVYWSAATDGRVLSGQLLTGYQALGGPGEVGFPLADQSAVSGGQAAAFQGGSIYWSAGTGAHLVRSAMLSAYWGTGAVTGPLGFPTADTTDVTGKGDKAGLLTDFSGGSIYWSSATGGHVLSGAVLAGYRSAGGPGQFGFPIADQSAVTGGQAAALEEGSIYWSAGTGAHAVNGAVRSDWWGRGGITGPLGFPTADSAAVTGKGGTAGQVGAFSGGTLYDSASTGTRLLSGAVLAEYQAAGGPAQLGFPIADQSAVTGGQAAALQEGSIYWSAGTGAHAVSGAIRSDWWGRGGITGPLGYPTADTVAVTGKDGSAGQVGAFSGGTLYSSPATGAHLVSGAVLAAYQAAGGPAQLGFPVADQGSVTGGEALALQLGSIYSSAGTGAHVVRGAALSAYWAAGAITGPLGFPTADTTALTANGLDGTTTAFQGGTIYATDSTGARVVRSSVDSLYRTAGGPAGTYGWPKTSSVAVGVQWRNDFQSGSITG